MKKPGYRYEFFISYLFSLQVVTWFTYVLAQTVLIGIFQQISSYFMMNRAILVISRLCYSFRTHYLEIFTCCKISMVHLLLFLDASTHLYKRVCPSVGPLVGHAFFFIAENAQTMNNEPTLGP